MKRAPTGLVEDSGFARVIHGNAFEGHQPRRRRRPSQRMRPALRRLVRQLLAFLLAPSPFDRRKGR